MFHVGIQSMISKMHGANNNANCYHFFIKVWLELARKLYLSSNVPILYIVYTWTEEKQPFCTLNIEVIKFRILLLRFNWKGNGNFIFRSWIANVSWYKACGYSKYLLLKLERFSTNIRWNRKYQLKCYGRLILIWNPKWVEQWKHSC